MLYQTQKCMCTHHMGYSLGQWLLYCDRHSIGNFFLIVKAEKNTVYLSHKLEIYTYV